MNGSLILRAAVGGDGRTVLRECAGRYPLQVLRPQVTAPHAEPAVGVHAGGLSLVMLLVSGGLLDGDSLAIDVTVEPGARLALRTQAATQVHAGRSCQTLRASVARNAWFSSVPHALVPHAGSDFSSETVVRMQQGARVLVAEALAPGRAHSAEAFAYARVRLNLDVWCDGTLLARERADVRPDPAVQQARFGPATHTASVYALGSGQPPLLEAHGSAILARSEIVRGGWYVRAVAERAADLDVSLARLQSHWWSA